MKKEILTQKYLKECLDYNPDTGVFIWKERPKYHFNKNWIRGWWNGQFSGSKAGTVAKGREYSKIIISNKGYYSHRLAFLWMAGSFPNKQVDHIDHNRSNNAWINLRQVSSKENDKNRKIYSTNSSGCSGVTLKKGTKKWIARISNKGKRYDLGSFSNIEDAINARKLAEIKYNFHENHGS